MVLSFALIYICYLPHNTTHTKHTKLRTRQNGGGGGGVRRGEEATGFGQRLCGKKRAQRERKRQIVRSSWLRRRFVAVVVAASESANHGAGGDVREAYLPVGSLLFGRIDR